MLQMQRAGDNATSSCCGCLAHTEKWVGNYTETVKEEGGGDGKIGGNMVVGRVEHLEHHALLLLIYT